MDADKIKGMRACSPLLPEPGGEVVCELLDEIERLEARLAKYQGLANQFDALARGMAALGETAQAFVDSNESPGAEESDG